MAPSKSLTAILLLLLVSTFVLQGQSIPFANFFRQLTEESPEPDDELPSATPDVDVTVEPTISIMPVITVTPIITPSPEAEVSMEPTPTNDDDEVCVDAQYLENVPSHHLVHPKSFPSTVLCPSDSSLPCATANHMIRVNGKPISYHAYCKNIKCEKKENVLVNSVLSHIWTEESHGKNIHLTMYDARHPEFLQKTLHRFISFKRRLV